MAQTREKRYKTKHTGKPCVTQHKNTIVTRKRAREGVNKETGLDNRKLKPKRCMKKLRYQGNAVSLENEKLPIGLDPPGDTSVDVPTISAGEAHGLGDGPTSATNSGSSLQQDVAHSDLPVVPVLQASIPPPPEQATAFVRTEDLSTGQCLTAGVRATDSLSRSNALSQNHPEGETEGFLAGTVAGHSKAPDSKQQPFSESSAKPMWSVGNDDATAHGTASPKEASGPEGLLGKKPQCHGIDQKAAQDTHIKDRGELLQPLCEWQDLFLDRNLLTLKPELWSGPLFDHSRQLAISSACVKLAGMELFSSTSVLWGQLVS